MCKSAFTQDPIILQLPSADRQRIEPCWEAATRLSSAKVFVDPLHAESCGGYRNSRGEGPILKGFAPRRAGEVTGSVLGGATLHVGLRKEEQLPLGWPCLQNVPHTC